MKYALRSISAGNRCAGTSTCTGRSTPLPDRADTGPQTTAYGDGGRCGQVAQVGIARCALECPPTRRALPRLVPLEPGSRAGVMMVPAAAARRRGGRAPRDSGPVSFGEQACPRRGGAGRGCRRSRSRSLATLRSEPSAPRCQPAVTVAASPPGSRPSRLPADGHVHTQRGRYQQWRLARLRKHHPGSPPLRRTSAATFSPS